jgi:hypothetical protein
MMITHVQRVVYDFQVVSYTRCKNCETGVCLHAATLLYTPTVIPDTLLIRDCGHEDLRVTIYQWSEFTMVRILLEVGELLCVATLALRCFLLLRCFPLHHPLHL